MGECVADRVKLNTPERVENKFNNEGREGGENKDRQRWLTHQTVY